MNTTTLIITIVIIILVLIVLYFNFSKGGSSSNTLQKDIKYKLSKISPNTVQNLHELKSILIEHDKLVDYYLQKKGVPGNTMGERLKNAKKLFDPGAYNAIWTAHKLRNAMVHEIGVDYKVETIKGEINNFRQALEKAR